VLSAQAQRVPPMTRGLELSRSFFCLAIPGHQALGCCAEAATPSDVQRSRCGFIISRDWPRVCRAVLPALQQGDVAANSRPASVVALQRRWKALLDVKPLCCSSLLVCGRTHPAGLSPYALRDVGSRVRLVTCLSVTPCLFTVWCQHANCGST